MGENHEGFWKEGKHCSTAAPLLVSLHLVPINQKKPKIHTENNGFKIQKAHWIHKIKLQHLFIWSLYSADGLRRHNPDRDQGGNFMVLSEAKVGDWEMKQ